MKGEDTRASILETALEVARLEGLDALSIGRLAKGVGLSKSGLFAHFKSKESLQLCVLEHGVEEFLQAVVRPALKAPRGEPRLRAIFDNWLAWAAGQDKGGCIFLGAAIEYDDRPGALRQYLVRTQHDWIQTLTRAVQITKAEGHLDSAVDPEALAFQIYGTMMSYHLYHRLLADPLAEERARRAFNELIAHNR